MAKTYATDLSSIQAGVWADLFYQGIDDTNTHPVMGVSTRHDMTGAAGSTVNFPVITPITATATADGTDTSFSTITPSNASATAYEIQAAISLSTFAQAVSPVKNLDQLMDTLNMALIDKIETDLVTESTAGPADNVSSNATAFDASVARLARAKCPNPQNVALWALNPTAEATLIADSSVGTAANYGNGAVISEGTVRSLYGAPVAVSSRFAANKSAMIGKNTMHWAVLQDPMLRVAYDPTKRSDTAILTAVIAVKYVATDTSKGCYIKHS